jgi:integrase
VEKKMRRKKIKLNHIHSKTERRRYASDLIGRVYEQLHIRKPLGLPAKYKFYSLKDTGVTMMLRANTDVLSVRDQARHSSILITDTYTPHDIAKVTPLRDKFECGF